MYDYVNQQEHREIRTSLSGIQTAKSLYLMRGDRYLVLCEEMGLTVIDIDTSQVVNPTVGYKDTERVVKMGEGVFVGLGGNGMVKVLTEGL